MPRAAVCRGLRAGHPLHPSATHRQAAAQACESFPEETVPPRGAKVTTAEIKHVKSMTENLEIRDSSLRKPAFSASVLRIHSSKDFSRNGCAPSFMQRQCVVDAAQKHLPFELYVTWKTMKT